MRKKVKEVKIIRGTDTLFSGNPAIKIQLNTKADLTGYTASLYFGSVKKDFTTEDVANKVLNLSYTHEETKTFFPGRGYALLRLYDQNGLQATIWRFVFNVVFPYDKHSCGGHGIEVVIGDSTGSANVEYELDTETLIVSFTEDVGGESNGYTLFGIGNPL